MSDSLNDNQLLSEYYPPNSRRKPGAQVSGGLSSRSRGGRTSDGFRGRRTLIAAASSVVAMCAA